MNNNENNILQDLSTDLTHNKTKDVRLYLITRILKEGSTRYKKELHKYEFKIYKIEPKPDLQVHLFNVCKQKVDNLVRDKSKQILAYEPVLNDEELILTYELEKQDIFVDIIKQLQNPLSIESVFDFKSIFNDLWAYCISINHDVNMFTHFFRKIDKNKVGIDELELASGYKKIRAKFNTADNKLELLEGETITFDKNIDCLYFNEKFYILSKNNFEKIINLEEEFYAKAKEFIEDINIRKFIEGIELLEHEITVNPSLNRKLCNIIKCGYHTNINKSRIMAMKKIAKEFELELKISDTKITISSTKDITSLIRLLDDYYLESMQKIGYYGTHNKTKLK